MSASNPPASIAEQDFPLDERAADSDDGMAQTVMAEIPVILARSPKKSKQTPQEAIDEFWSKFTTKAPGKATTIIPHNEYAKRAAKRPNKTTGTTTQASYEEAAAVCRTKVAKIVKECRRVNQKYRDPHFDLEFDLKWGRHDTLESLRNAKGKPSEFTPKSVKRVKDIFDDPQFFVDGPTANDVRQGRDGDCWLLAALCTLSNKPSLIERVCVARDEQVGVYGFVFHRDGEWISEIIDDKLFLTKPDFDESFLERILWEDRERVNSEEQYRKAYQSGSGALYFAQCEHNDETWLPLLEKAYAKAHGDYAAIEGGFTGEGIEDLTGGVTTELYTTDILDKEYFWKEELMKVNDEYLFGCATGMWGIGWGDRKGIVELHAYSVMTAVEIDGQRLVRLKNPWGKGEWKGAWSDGSKEWTAEWLTKLNHRFGDDGNFWISYDDLLKKYQAFDRTRLFGPDWKMVSAWATVQVPWTLDYHDTYFSFSLAKAGPVVIVLSQLDNRYYRGLEGQYRFELNFRLHKKHQEDYVVRSISPYCQSRSVNVELELDDGEYTVLMKINASRNLHIMPIEEVIRNHARDRRDKLVAVGMSYDLAHSKGEVLESEEEKRARKAAEKRKLEKERQEIKKAIMKERRRGHYMGTKEYNKMIERKARRKARRQAKAAQKAEKQAARKQVKEKVSPSPEETPSMTSDKNKHVQLLSPVASPSPTSEDSADPGVKTPPAESTADIFHAPDSIIETPAEGPVEAPTETPEADKVPVSGEISPKQADPQPQQAEVGKDQTAEVVNTPTQSDEEQGDDSDDESVPSGPSSVSDMSERELDYKYELMREANDVSPPPPAGSMPPNILQQEEDEFEQNPWNAVATVGLRVYYKVSEEDKDKEIVQLRVIRPNPYARSKVGDFDDENDDDDKKTDDKEDKDETEEGKEPKSSMGLDVDDASKDATLEGDFEQRKKSILSRRTTVESTS
ncbi:hypothetical protein F5Y16DRAFT_358893 [Xylariaceae sp. FL0255]|nr:hypothetical protein F5Y16DRAFT_358893 [Xylariaceae sp. FL0255]